MCTQENIKTKCYILPILLAVFTCIALIFRHFFYLRHSRSRLIPNFLSRKVLLASRRHELYRRCKHCGNMADGLQALAGRTSGKMTRLLGGGDKNGDGTTAFVQPSKTASFQRNKLTESPTLDSLDENFAAFYTSFIPFGSRACICSTILKSTNYQSNICTCSCTRNTNN